ncbi:transgelin [Entomortierella parvispora]|uniref:Transgelin n=1 Tax=Entomortierella parvispora TaxID=205924 RepID=A0A9P3HDK6_9FUNG|nr:transgelin [Entomortierella parvispora]
MADFVRTRHRSGAIDSASRPLPPRIPVATATTSSTLDSTFGNSTSSNNININSSSNSTSPSSPSRLLPQQFPGQHLQPPFVPVQQQSRIPPGPTSVPGMTRLRSGSNPLVEYHTLAAQRRARESSSSGSGASISTNTSSGTSASSNSTSIYGSIDSSSHNRIPSHLDETGFRSRSSPGPGGYGQSSTSRTGTPIGSTTTTNAGSSSSPVHSPAYSSPYNAGYTSSGQGTTRARAATSSGTAGYLLSNDRSAHLAPMVRERSSGSTSNLTTSPRQPPSPVPRTHSHSVSVPAVYPNQLSSRTPTPTRVGTGFPSPPSGLRSSIAPPAASAPSSTLSVSNPSQGSATTRASSTQGSNNIQGTSPLQGASAVDVVGKRLREQQQQDRFKAAQSFIERTTGKKLPSSDLHESLKDGVILCELANQLSPKIVRLISRKEFPFLQMENILNFVEAARQLGVQSSDLFQTVDLFEGKDMNQVVSTILTLERVTAGGVGKLAVKEKRPGPSPMLPPKPSPAQPPKGLNGAVGVTRMRSKTAHAIGAASTTASIRPSSSAYYAAQVRKLEEDSIRFANGYDRLDTAAFKVNDRHQSSPIPNKDFASNKADLASPASSRSSTPVQGGVRKNTISDQPMREKLELWENDTLTATFKLGGFCIGRGQFGAVYKAMNMVTGQMVAVKRIKIDGLKDAEMDLLMQEVDLLKSLEHPSIVKYEGFIKTDGHLNIILEFVENGSLLTTLKSFGTFPEKLVVAYVVKILEGLVYLHGKEVVHCDLKAANILTTKNGNVKLSDFGVSLNLKVKESDFGAVAGTPNWMAPEVIELKGASPASDIWSLGCTIIEMLTGRPPYAELLAMTTLFRIVEDERPPLPNNLSVDLLDFLCQCFQKDPTLRPSAGALGRHVWVKRNFASRELKPMDSLPYMTRKSMEPKDKSLITAALEGGTKRASTPSGLTSGAPPPAASASILHIGRGIRRGSVDSASSYYSSTVPGPSISQEKMYEMNKGAKIGNQHQFVKSSFAKPVECRLCHDFVKKQAVICQDCSLVFHRKCQFYVGETCFPGPHLSYFGSPSPAQSVPNLKLLASGTPLRSSRPTSRTSQQNDRSRSVTPSQGTSRPCPTPPLLSFPMREGAASNDRADRRQMSPPPLPLNSVYRISSPESYPESGSYNGQSQPPRPPSRQTDSPTSPTLSGLRGLISGPRRFSFGAKKTPQSSPSTNHHPLPTPPTSYTSNTTAFNAQRQTPTPDSGRSSANGYSQSPTTPPQKSIPVPIMRSKNGSGGRPYRGREYLPGGPLDPFEDEQSNTILNNYGRGHQRPSSITLFSTSAPPVPVDYSSDSRSSSSISLQSSLHSSFTKYSDDEDDDDHNIDDIDDMDERDLEALLIPSVVRTPRTSIDAGHPMIGYRSKSQSISQTLSQQQHQSRLDEEFASLKAFNAKSAAQDIHKKSPPKAPAAISFGSPPGNRDKFIPHHRAQRSFGSTAATTDNAAAPTAIAPPTSRQRKISTSSSSGSSLGSIAAHLEEEERMMKLSLGLGGPVPASKSPKPLSAYQMATSPPQSNHVGLKTMLSRLSPSTSNATVTATTTLNGAPPAQEAQPNQTSRDSSKASVAYAAAARHQIQAPLQYQQHPHSQPPPRSIHPFQPSSSETSSDYNGHPYGGAVKGEIYPQHLNGYGPGHGGNNGFAQGNNGRNGRTTPGGDLVSPPIPAPLSSNNASTTVASSAAAAAASLASSALKRGGKVIRRSIGATER